MNYQTISAERIIPTIYEFGRTLTDNCDVMSKYKVSDAVKSTDTNKPSLYSITTKFNDIPKEYRDALNEKRNFSGRYPYSEELIKIAHKWQYKFYQHVRNQTVSNSHRSYKNHLHPFAICFIDFPGSRDCKPRITEMPHFHSLFLVPSRTKEKFKQLVDDDFRLERNPNKTQYIQSYLCEEKVWLESILWEDISYCSKFLRNPIAKNFSQETQAELFEIYGKGAKKKP